MGTNSGIDRVLSGRGRKVAVGLALLALLALPVSNVLANHQFTDVPTSSPYHDHIAAIANAQITGGCGGSKYCPQGLVTREQMAVFLNRLGNLSNEHGPVVDALTVLGQLVFADVEDFVLAGGASQECETSTNQPPPVSATPDPSEIFGYSIVHQLRDAPIQTDLVNVQIKDVSQTDEMYEVCFRTVDASNLAAGTYKTYYWAGLTVGGGLFADAGVSSASVDRFRKAFK